MPAPSWRISPARTISLCDFASASAGGSFSVGSRYRRGGSWVARGSVAWRGQVARIRSRAGCESHDSGPTGLWPVGSGRPSCATGSRCRYPERPVSLGQPVRDLVVKPLETDLGHQVAEGHVHVLEVRAPFGPEVSWKLLTLVFCLARDELQPCRAVVRLHWPVYWPGVAPTASRLSAPARILPADRGMAPSDSRQRRAGVAVPLRQRLEQRQRGFTHRTSEFVTGPISSAEPQQRAFRPPEVRRFRRFFEEARVRDHAPGRFAACRPARAGRSRRAGLRARARCRPAGSAETSLTAAAGFGSISSLISCSSIAAPWECPISTKPRPCCTWQVFLERRDHADEGRRPMLRGDRLPRSIAASVTCGYIGAYTLQSCEKREAWSIAIGVSCGSTFRLAFSATGCSRSGTRRSSRSAGSLPACGVFDEARSVGQVDRRFARWPGTGRSAIPGLHSHIVSAADAEAASPPGRQRSHAQRCDHQRPRARGHAASLLRSITPPVVVRPPASASAAS